MVFESKTKIIEVLKVGDIIVNSFNVLMVIELSEGLIALCDLHTGTVDYVGATIKYIEKEFITGGSYRLVKSKNIKIKEV